jgi:hypothetical protein
MTSASYSRLQGSYGLRHQLYESLTSHLDAHGNYEDSSSFSSTATNDRYGLGWSENYSKRLSRWGHLSVGTGIVADHQDYNSSGGIIPVIGEAHTLYLPGSPDYRPEYLPHPAVITVMDVYAGPQKLTRDSDYRIVQSGELTEVQLIFPASAVVAPLLQGPNLDSLNVTVTYQYHAPNNASFESLNSSLQIRLDLPGHLGLYGRMNWLANNAPTTVLTETLTDTIAGVDYSWRWLRTGAEYEDYDSNFSKYEAWRFFQDLTFHPDDVSTLSVDFLQTFYTYPNRGSQTQYQFLTRYNVQLLFSLAWYVEGGYSLQNVLGTDESLATAKTGLSWSRGKLSLRTGYEFNSQTTSSGQWTEDRVRNRFYAYMKRTF